MPTQRAPAPRGLLATLASDWQVDPEHDRAFLTVGGLMFFSHTARLALRKVHPLLTPAQHAQNFLFLAGMLLLLALLRTRPGAYRRWSPALKLLLLVYGYARPVFGAGNARDPIVDSPSTVPVLGPLVDCFVLWMCCRGTFLSFAAVGFRPPLYLALPLQLYGVWRVSLAGHCGTPLLMHPVVQRRTASLHGVFSFIFESAVGNQSVAPMLAAAGPTKRCQAALLFCHALSSVLVPLLLLLPWQQPARPPAGGHALSASARLEAWLQQCLGQLLRPWPAPAAATAAGRQEADGRGTGASLLAFLLHWLLVLLALWSACTLLAIAA